MPEDSQLDRIEGMLHDRLGKIEKHLRDLNGKVASHEQTLYGPRGHGGVSDDVRALFERAKPGTVNVRTMWSAIGALTAIVTVLVMILIGTT